ncbi:MAG: trypsin-like peptidase domain-containing protein, partial [Phycisphaerales bacterium]
AGDKSRSTLGQAATAATCSGSSVTDSNNTDHSIPLDDWTYSESEIDNAPPSAVVTCLDVHYEIIHSWVGDLSVDLCDDSLSVEYRLWDEEGEDSANINETVTGITAFSGLAANQRWSLWAMDNAPGDTGYINSWWIKVYYQTVPAPANDLCLNAIVLQDGVPYQGTTVGATGEYETRCSIYDAFDVWHVFTATRTGLVTISLDSSDFDTTLAVFEECGSQELICSDDAGEQTNSEITLRMMEGEDYYIRVAGYRSGWGAYTVTATQNPVVLPDEPDTPSPADGTEVHRTGTVLSWNDSAGLFAGLGAKALRRPIEATRAKAIYGRDDRTEEYQVTDPAFLAAGDATVLLMPWENLTDNGDGTYTLPSETLAWWYKDETGNTLCPDEPFRDQPSPGECSGVLVAPDLVATAGHCASAPISDVAVVFGFVMEDAGTPVMTLNSDQVYRCVEVVAYQEYPDWSLLRLDRPVVGHVPQKLRVAGQVSDGQGLLAVGHPSGVPRKYDAGSIVRYNVVNISFEANSDTYQGSSGSPVFNLDSMEVEGLLVQGRDDFVEDPQGDCYRSQVYPDDGSWWEVCTRITILSYNVPSFDVYIGTDPDSLQRVSEHNPAPWYDPGTLSAGATYYWRVVARNVFGEVQGPLWSFSTTEGGTVLHDWNDDGIVSIVGDVPPFVQCCYFNDCPDGVDTIAVGDCNGDGILSIVGDVPCFVDCVYFNNCDE